MIDLIACIFFGGISAAGAISLVLVIIQEVHNRKAIKEAKKTSFSAQFKFSVHDYLERMEKLACEQDVTFIPVELWWGYDGWRQKQDGSFEKVRRWKPEPTINPIDYSMCQCTDEQIADLQKRIMCLQMQATQFKQTQAVINSIPMPGYLHTPAFYSGSNWCGYNNNFDF